MIRFHFQFLCAIVLCAAATSCSTAPKAEAKISQNPESPIVAVAKVGRSDLSRQLVLTAEFHPFQEVELMAKVAGYVKAINVDVGDRVRQGQLLATLEIPEMAVDITRGEAAVSRAQAEVTRAKDELQRAESAHQLAHLSYSRLADVFKQKAGLVAQQEVDDVHSKDLVSEAQVSSAKSSLTAAEEQVHVNAAELKRVQTMQDYTRVIAPFTGVITKRYADTGTMLQAGTASSTQAMPLVRLSENSRLRLILPVPESAVPTVHIGQTVEVKVPTLNRSFPGVVARFSDKVSPATRTMDTEVDVPNPSLLLIPGMYAEVDLTLANRARVLTVPLQAVDVAGDDPTSGKVSAVSSSETIDVRNVKLGMQSSTGVEILSGLSEGDIVVIAGRANLRAGEKVQPKVAVLSAGKGE